MYCTFYIGCINLQIKLSHLSSTPIPQNTAKWQMMKFSLSAYNGHTWVKCYPTLPDGQRKQIIRHSTCSHYLFTSFAK